MKFNAGDRGSEALESKGKEEDKQPAEPMVMPKDGSQKPVPLAIYPPGLELCGYVILWPAGSVDEWNAELAEKWQAVQREEQGDPQTEDSGGGDPSCGFYRVVRVGVKLWGITNGMVLSGTVRLPVELGDPETNRTVDVVFLAEADGDDAVPGTQFPDLTGGEASLSGEWNTTAVPNGCYTVQVVADLSDQTVLRGAPLMVIVSNAICFPDPWPVGGMAVYIGAKTIFTNGTWSLRIYDDQGRSVGWLNGPIDGNGYCAWPGIPGPGFSLNNTDGHGNQNPSAFYTLALTATALGGGASATLTNKVCIEPAWFHLDPTRAAICHMQLFSPNQSGWTDMRILMNAIQAVMGAFHPNLLGDVENPFEIASPGAWHQVVSALTNWLCRDFVYMGHANASFLGTGDSVLRVETVRNLLRNHFQDPLQGTNRHPFRFVFLDGCKTARGNWPQAFGIPKQENMTAADFWEKRGIRPRAFVGWNRNKFIGFGWVMWSQALQWRTTFWQEWSRIGRYGYPDQTLRDAVNAANEAAWWASWWLKIYGAEDLYIDY